MNTRSHRIAAAALVAAFAAALPARLVAQQGGVPVVTLVEARRRAAAVDPATVAARANLATAAWERRSARADLLTPHVAATSTYTAYNDAFFSFTGTPSANTAFATAQATYAVLGSGKLAELRRSNASLATAEAVQDATRFRTALATDAAYYGVLAETELARVTTERLRRANEGLAVARVRVQAGETIATDSLQLLLEANRAQLEVLRSDSALTVARLRLGRQIGLAGPADAAPLDSLPPPALPLSFEAASAELRARGPDLVAARAAERQADAVVAAQRSQYLPDVALGVAWTAYDAAFFPSYLQRNAFSVTVSLPIWDAGRRELAFARARGQRDVARSLREEDERATAEVMAQAYNGYRTARAGIDLTQVGVAAATENYRVQVARYREGATTILDLLEAQVTLGQAEAAHVQARHAARLSLAQIEALLGRRLFTDGN